MNYIRRVDRPATPDEIALYNKISCEYTKLKETNPDWSNSDFVKKRHLAHESVGLHKCSVRGIIKFYTLDEEFYNFWQQFATEYSLDHESEQLAKAFWDAALNISKQRSISKEDSVLLRERRTTKSPRSLTKPSKVKPSIKERTK